MFTHTLTQVLGTPEGAINDTGAVASGDTSTAVDTTVDSHAGGAANAVSVDFTAAGLQSLGLLASVPCIVTLTGATVIDGVTTSTVTLQAGVLRRVTAITGNVTGLSVGANTDLAGAAGTINIRALYNS